MEAEHNSYGMIGISHITSGAGIPLFGSAIKHERFISLRIHKAEMERHLHREWYYAREPVIEVHLSAAQFTEFITSPNQGDGVPCTIKHINRDDMDETPYHGQNEIFANELDEDFKKATIDSDALLKEAREVLNKKGPLKVSERKELLSKIEMLSQHIKSNIPFLHKQFTMAMNKTVNVAKAEIDGFYTSTIMKLGKKALSRLNSPSVPKIE